MLIGRVKPRNELLLILFTKVLHLNAGDILDIVGRVERCEVNGKYVLSHFPSPT